MLELAPMGFLREKLKTYSVTDLLWGQWEAFTIWIFQGIPGLPGFVLRNLTSSILFKKKSGFAWIQPNIFFVHTDRLSVGKNLGVNSGTYINAVGTIVMGDFVLIGSNVTISSGKHPIDGIVPHVYERPVEPLPILIEDGVWIGAGAVIMPGVTLRKGTVVGANSVVTRSTEEYSVVVGVPARKIRSRYVEASDA
jgi:acetyltransferase-like isoleucine patch superfamily enzyme